MNKAMTATEVPLKEPEAWTGTAKLYRLSRPYEVRDWDDEVKMTVSYVIVSAVVALFSGPETYIFPADEKGEVVSWGELPGSFKGGLDHNFALERFLASVNE